MLVKASQVSHYDRHVQAASQIQGFVRERVLGRMGGDREFREYNEEEEEEKEEEEEEEEEEHDINDNLQESDLKESPLRHRLAAKRPGAVPHSLHDLFVWGENTNGELSSGKSMCNEALPRLVRGPKGKQWAQISLGLNHTVALTTDGSILTCGSWVAGLLGHPVLLSSLLSQFPLSLRGTITHRTSHTA